MKNLIAFIAVAGLAFGLNSAAQPVPPSKGDIKLTEAALAKLSLEERVAQLSGVRLNAVVENGKLSLKKCEELIPHGIGHVSQFASCMDMTPEQLAATVAELQQFIIAHNGAGVPAIFHEEAISGFAAPGATTYPQQINLGCTWNPALVQSNAAATARAMRAVGAVQALSPMLDVINDARWGRSEEGFGEDPYLTAVMGAAFIRGLQGSDLRHGVAATAKHFAGYGNSPTNLAQFRDEVLLPHDAAVHAAGVASVMPGYHEYLGEPSSSSQLLLNQILRQEWNFNGPIVSDYGAIGQIFRQYKKATNDLDAAVRSLSAGMDVELPSLETYRDLPQAMRDGRVPASLVENALRRQLLLKAQLGLLNAAPTNAPAALDLNPADNQARAYNAAAQSIVLLKNNGALPLGANVRSIAVVGPNADSFYPLLGDYTYQMMMEFWWRKPVNGTSPRLVTLLTGLREQMPGVNISFARGCDWTHGLDEMAENKGAIDPRLKEGNKREPLERVPPTHLEAALKLAAESDVIIAAMGENRYLCGEGVDRQDIRLPGEQEEFLQRLAATGKPVILVVFGGRPMALGNVEPLCAAILYAWYPGQSGGTALADILRGAVNPAGRLTMTLPRDNAQVPISYRLGYTPEKTPLYPFGYGLSYTHFDYAKLKAPKKVKTSAAEIPVRFTLTNGGQREGAEVCQLYLKRDGKQELKGFARVELPPGKSCTVTIKVPLDALGHFTATGQLVIAPGPVEIRVGASASDLRLKAELQVVGEVVTKPRREKFFSETTAR